ncbi:MAG: flagellar basal body rod protein FlgB [Spirochaetae bacterium HGW-Spirochaetae-3]|jgi:flagellar basal-body rod protein FlgB|nr:MAG: flagellar basal body rod protein FlgB [Spirochaetae bacterium HGW-Spirochaetae-3]
MLENTTFGRTIDLLQRSMDVSVLRYEVIGNNVANADVPNFKRSEINFESSLKRAIDSEKSEPRLQLATSETGHIASWKRSDWRDVTPRRVLDYLSTSKNNGNNVDAEQEFMAAMQNQLRYTLMTQATAFEFNQVNQVLK